MRHVFTAVAAGAAVVLSGCTMSVEEMDNHHHRTFQTGATPRVRVEMFGGNIDVLGVPDQEVSADLGIKRPIPVGPPLPSQVHEPNMAVVMEQDANGDVLVALQLRHELWNERLSCCNRPYVKLRVPEGAVLDLVTGDGDVTVTGVTGPQEAAAPGRVTVNGENNGAKPACEIEAQDQDARADGQATDTSAQ